MANMKNKGAKGGARKKRRVNRNIDKGQAHIQASFNNTIVTFTDEAGNAVSWCSAGALGYKGAKRGTAYVGQQVCEVAAKAAKEQGLNTVDVFVKGPGQGRESAIRAIATAEIGVNSIKDVSPIPHNGCRPPKRRRV